MFEILLKNINNVITLTAEEEELIKSFFIEKKVRKRYFLAHEGDSSKYLIFVNEGALISYITDEKGNNYTMQFAVEGWWITDVNSFINDEPSLYNIEAVEDSWVLMLSLENYHKILSEIPKMEKYWRIMMEKRMAAMQRRIMILLSYPLEKNYKRLLEVYPDLSSRFPQHLIASYLGISAETLSRLRRSINSKK